MPLVHVRAQRRVAGLTYNEEAWLEATPYVDSLVRSGMLVWLDEPRVAVFGGTLSVSEAAKLDSTWAETKAKRAAAQIEPSHVGDNWLVATRGDGSLDDGGA